MILFRISWPQATKPCFYMPLATGQNKGIYFFFIKHTSKVQNKGAHLFFGQKQPHNGHIFRVAKCQIFYTAWFVTDKVYPVNSFKLFTCQNLLKIKCCQSLKLRHLVFKILKRHKFTPKPCKRQPLRSAFPKTMFSEIRHLFFFQN